jgi:hypothetical protein
MEYTQEGRKSFLDMLEKLASKKEAFNYKIKVLGAGNMPSTLNDLDPLDAVQAMDAFQNGMLDSLPLALRDSVTRKMIFGKIIKFYLEGRDAGSILLNDYTQSWNSFPCIKETPYLLSVLFNTVENELLKKSLPPLFPTESSASEESAAKVEPQIQDSVLAQVPVEVDLKTPSEDA